MTKKRYILSLCFVLWMLIFSGVTVRATELLPEQPEQHQHKVITEYQKASVGGVGKEISKCEICNEVFDTVTFPGPKSMKLSYETCVYNGDYRKPSVQVYDVNGKLMASSEYKVTYASGRKYVGTYTVNVSFQTDKYTGTLTKSFKILPMTPKNPIASSTANRIEFSWDRVLKQVSGYQVAYSKSSTFPEGSTSYKKISGYTNNQCKIRKLPVGSTYYVRVRTYKEVDGKTYYSGWSDRKTVKIKQKSLSLNAKSAIIMEAGSKKVYYTKYANTKRANASTTKMMTAILALEKKSLTSKVKITKSAANTPYSILGSRVVGDYITMKDVLHMVLLPSDNGAATALAIHTSGSTSAFVSAMNKKAASLGMKNTQFKNPHGLDASGHYSTAKDLAILADYCLKNKTFASIIKKKSYSFRSVNRNIYYKVYTRNRLLGEISGVVGMKTGTEANAGNCFVCAYEHSGKTYITVVLGCSSDSYRWSNTRKLINYIDNYL